MRSILKIFLICALLVFNFSYSVAKTKIDTTGKGYLGHLPDISKYFQYKIKEVKSPPPKDIKIEEINKDNYVDAPLKDDLFLDVIIQYKKPSQYTKDILDIVKILEKFRLTIQNGADIQQFNANVNLLDLYVTRLERDYGKTSESLSKSYNKLLELNYYAKLLGNLKYEANYYSKYQAVLDEQYTPTYIKGQEDSLFQEMSKLIFLLKSECDNSTFTNK